MNLITCAICQGVNHKKLLFDNNIGFISTALKSQGKKFLDSLQTPTYLNSFHLISILTK